jgi:hypothetical protein
MDTCIVLLYMYISMVFPHKWPVIFNKRQWWFDATLYSSCPVHSNTTFVWQRQLTEMRSCGAHNSQCTDMIFSICLSKLHARINTALLNDMPYHVEFSRNLVDSRILNEPFTCMSFRETEFYFHSVPSWNRASQFRYNSFLLLSSRAVQ